MKSTQTDLLEPINSAVDVTSSRTETGRNKDLYVGYFNLGREVIIRRTQAKSPAKAKMNLLSRIAQEKGLKGLGGLTKVFDGTKDNYTIEKEVREGEGD